MDSTSFRPLSRRGSEVSTPIAHAMLSVVTPPRDPPSSAARHRPSDGSPRRLERWVHEGFEGTPYFDEELQVPQGTEHQVAVFEIGTILQLIARDAGLVFKSDHPIWYLHPETDEQRRAYGDLVLAKPTDEKTITAEDLLVVIEVVSIADRRKEIKDAVFQRALNEYNGVPEFGLLFPDLGDARSLIWYSLDRETGRYDELSLSPGSEVTVEGVPGLVLRVKPAGEWEPGSKVEVRYLGELRRPLAQERERAEQERERAEQEHERAEQEHERAEQERERAEKLSAQLRALGIDPSK